MMKPRLKLHLDGSISCLDAPANLPIEPLRDWHSADVKAALEKKGVTLRGLAKEYGYSHIQRVLVSHWWAAEQVVAKALGLPAEQIWPSRYLTPRDRGRGMTRNSAVHKLFKRGARRAGA